MFLCAYFIYVKISLVFHIEKNFLGSWESLLCLKFNTQRGMFLTLKLAQSTALQIDWLSVFT